jgi:transcription initiation factor TFIIIB Brf1 subunit/transcription initiation factor TFIIB
MENNAKTPEVREYDTREYCFICDSMVETTLKSAYEYAEIVCRECGTVIYTEFFDDEYLI